MPTGKLYLVNNSEQNVGMNVDVEKRIRKVTDTRKSQYITKPMALMFERHALIGGTVGWFCRCCGQKLAELKEDE